MKFGTFLIAKDGRERAQKWEGERERREGDEEKEG